MIFFLSFFIRMRIVLVDIPSVFNMFERAGETEEVSPTSSMDERRFTYAQVAWFCAGYLSRNKEGEMTK